MTSLQSKGHTANRWTTSYFVCREKSENKNKRRQRNLTNATPLDVLNTTETAVLTEEQTTDGTIATEIYEEVNLKRFVIALVTWDEAKKKDLQA
jgi:hypothetical protein